MLAAALGRHARHGPLEDLEERLLHALDLAPLVRVDALVVVVHGDGEGLFGLLLPDHVLVQHVLDLGRRRDLRDRLGDLSLLVLRENLVAERDALIANVDGRSGNEFPDRVLRLAAEGAAEVLIVGHLALVWERRVPGASRHFFFPSSISWKLAITWSISPYSLASSADMKRSRSMSFSMCSTGLPVCLA